MPRALWAADRGFVRRAIARGSTGHTDRTVNFLFLGCVRGLGLGLLAVNADAMAARITPYMFGRRNVRGLGDSGAAGEGGRGGVPDAPPHT